VWGGRLGGTLGGVGKRFGGSGEDGAHQKRHLHNGGIRSVWTCRWWLGIVAGAADSGSGEHQGDGAVLEEVAVGPEVAGRGLSVVMLTVKDEARCSAVMKASASGWLMDKQRRSLGARRQLARMVAQRHSSAPTAAASEAGACGGVDHGAERRPSGVKKWILLLVEGSERISRRYWDGTETRGTRNLWQWRSALAQQGHVTGVTRLELLWRRRSILATRARARRGESHRPGRPHGQVGHTVPSGPVYLPFSN
jgi:hypothetical protein